MTHPNQTDLALFAGGELGLWARHRLRRHLARCEQCRREADRFEEARWRLRGIGDTMPAEVNWSRLATEMRGNIRVGLAAGECVGPVEGARPRLGLRTAATLVPVMLVLLAGWFLQRSQPELPAAPEAEGIVLEATSDGIQLRQGGGVLSLQHPGSGDVTLTVNMQGTLRARWVDAETGNVTINHVYAQ